MRVGGIKSAGSLSSVSHLNSAAVKKLPLPLHDAYLQAFTNALTTAFAVAAAVAAVSFLISWLLEERALRGAATASTGVGETFAVPDHGLVTLNGPTVTGLTPEGHRIAERLMAERRASMERLLEGWSAGDPDLAALLTRLAREVGREPPHPQEVAEPVGVGTPG